jgi:hypothetical protein
MSNSKDKGSLGKNVDPDKPYKVGNKKPPLHTRFPKGKSGNPGGRPKGRSKDLTNVGQLLMKELYKTVPVNMGGKIVNKMQAEVLVAQMVKQAIAKGGVSTRLALKFMEEHEAREAAKEERKAKQVAEGSSEIDWDAEREETYRRLRAQAASILQSPAQPTNE